MARFQMEVPIPAAEFDVRFEWRGAWRIECANSRSKVGAIAIARWVGEDGLDRSKLCALVGTAPLGARQGHARLLMAFETIASTTMDLERSWNPRNPDTVSASAKSGLLWGSRWLAEWDWLPILASPRQEDLPDSMTVSRRELRRLDRLSLWDDDWLDEAPCPEMRALAEALMIEAEIAQGARSEERPGIRL